MSARPRTLVRESRRQASPADGRGVRHRHMLGERTFVSAPLRTLTPLILPVPLRDRDPLPRAERVVGAHESCGFVHATTG